MMACANSPSAKFILRDWRLCSMLLESEEAMPLNKDAVHPATFEALEAVDAQMFSGDPGETEDMFNLLKFYVDRWTAKMKEVEQDPWFNQTKVQS